MNERKKICNACNGCKPIMTIEEAADYFGIGVKRLRYLASLQECSSFVLTVGSQKRIKKKQFEEFLDQAMAL